MSNNFLPLISVHIDELNPLLSALTTALSRVQMGLVYEMGGVRNGKREFIISADGNKQLFPILFDLAASAPNLARWTILKFRQRAEDITSLTLSFGDFTLDHSHLSFIIWPELEECKVGIQIFVSALESNLPKVQQGVFILLDQALGEYQMETLVGSITICAESEPSLLAKVSKDITQCLTEQYDFEPERRSFAELQQAFDRMSTVILRTQNN